MAPRTLILAALASSASAVNLWLSAYSAPDAVDGTTSTLKFTPGVGAAKLEVTSTKSGECGNQPTWLDHTLGGKYVYCVDEGWGTPNASLNTLKINSDGSLTKAAKLDTVQGPVSTQFYNNGEAVVLAHYGGHSVASYKLSSDKKTFSKLQNFYYNTPNGPHPAQDGSHPHHAVLDPTGKYIVVPDLGADTIRTYGIDAKTSLLTEQKAFDVAKGSGPRHAAFWTPKTGRYVRRGKDTPTYLFVVLELTNLVVSYEVKYTSSGLTLTEVESVSSYGPNYKTDTTFGRGAEIVVSPDNKYVIASNRNVTDFLVANPDPKNSTKIPSNSLATFEPSEKGKLKFVQLAPSGGVYPRHFSYNKAGTLVAVANQNSGNVHIWARDVKTGKLGERVAAVANLPGGPNNVIWDE